MAHIIDDKSEICIPFILDRLNRHQLEYQDAHELPPFFIGLNGVQGVGKTTLVNLLHKTLQEPPYSLPVVVLSIDDLYLTHADQVRLAQFDPSNKLIQHRGEPGTHDMSLAARLLEDLKNGQETSIPSYDKSLFNGQGDRTDPSLWTPVNQKGKPKVKVILLEGWCVGFRALRDGEVQYKWASSVEQHKEGTGATTTLWQHEFSHLLFINDQLRGYNVITNLFNAMIHIDAENTEYVYAWRLQQEREMIAAKGSGMSEEEVIKFVDGYYPAYELYTESLRNGIYGKDQSNGRQLRVIVNRDRKVVESKIF